MGLYDMDEDYKEKHNYLCGKNGGKIIFKETNFYECEYGIDNEDNFAIAVEDNENNMKFFEKLQTKKYIAYFVGFVIIEFENENSYYGFSIDEIMDKINKKIVFYLVSNKEIINKVVVNLVLV